MLTPETQRPWLKSAILFLAGQGVSMFGSALVQYAIVWHITLSTQSGAMMTISTLCGFLPQLLISLFAGVWADRYSRKMLIILSDSMIALSTLALAILFLSGQGALWMLFVASSIRSLGAGIQSPAVQAVLPQLVPQDKLLRVNGVNSSMQSLMMLISPAVSGALLGFASIEMIFFIDVVTAVIGIGLLLCLRVPNNPHAQTAQQEGYLRSITGGMRYLIRHSFLRRFMGFYAVLCFAVVPAALLTPLMVARSFGPEVWRLTANELTFSAGALVGGLLISAWGGLKNKMRTIGLACLVFGVGNTALGLAPDFTIYLGVMVAVGLTLPYINTPAITLLQQVVDTQFYGRVFSLVQIISTTVMPLGMVLFGPLSDQVPVEALLIVTGVLLVLAGLFLMLDRKLTTIPESAPVPAEPMINDQQEEML